MQDSPNHPGLPRSRGLTPLSPLWWCAGPRRAAWIPRLLQGLRAGAPDDTTFVHRIEHLLPRRLGLTRAFLRRYRTGGGPIQLRDPRLVRDPGFLAWLAPRLHSHPEQGRDRIPQWHLAHPDLRCALGSFSVAWQPGPGASLALSAHGIYAWSPDDPRRPTAPLHRAAARLPGASPFSWRLETSLRTPLPPPRPWSPDDRLHL